MTQALIDALAAAIQQAAQQGTPPGLGPLPPGAAFKAVSSTPSAVMGHGTNGLFNYPGLEPAVVNAMVMPELGLLDVLPSRTANTDNPLHGIMTGVTDTSGSNPTGVCDDPKTSGLMKLCTHAFQWGRQSLMTKVYDLDKFGHVRDRSDFTDFQLYGNPLMDNPHIPQMPAGAAAAAAIRSDIAKALFEFAVSWGREWAPVIYTGNPTNNTSGGGYKEPYGLDILINDGYRDAVTGTACPAADSIVRDFGSLAIESNSDAIVNQLIDMYYQLKQNARRMGLMPATWALVGPSSLFRSLTQIWACAYQTYMCANNTTSEILTVNPAEVTKLRDDMRQGKYLLIEGEKVAWLDDDGVAITNLAGSSYKSTIYFVPLRYVGNRPATFIEYFNYDGPGAAMDAARVLAPAGSYYTTNGGRFLWHAKPPTNFCVQLLAKTEWRVILETPQIAGRLENVKWTPLSRERGWDPADASFYVNGGATTRVDNSYYSPTS